MSATSGCKDKCFLRTFLSTQKMHFGRQFFLPGTYWKLQELPDARNMLLLFSPFLTLFNKVEKSICISVCLSDRLCLSACQSVPALVLVNIMRIS